MPTTFIDGPAAGWGCTLRRAPQYLRVVHRPGRGAKGWDALNLLEDKPAQDELVYVYEAVPGTFGRACVRPGGCVEWAIYRQVPDADGELLRETSSWRAWVEERVGPVDLGTGASCAASDPRSE